MSAGADEIGQEEERDMTTRKNTKAIAEVEQVDGEVELVLEAAPEVEENAADAKATKAAKAHVQTIKEGAESDLLTDPRKVRMIAAVKAHATEHYNDEGAGWDMVVETMTDLEISRIVYLCRSEKGAIEKIRAYVQPAADMRTEVVNA